MEKNKTALKKRKKSLRFSFAMWMAGGLLAGLIFSAVSSAFCQWGANQLYEKYKDEMGRQKGYLVSEETDEIMQSHIYFYLENPNHVYSKKDLLIDQILSVLSVVVVPFWFILCILWTSVCFYRTNLKKPLELLDLAAGKIAEQDLDFTLHYEKQDEMGRLCDSFEKMRASLEENKKEMWRQVEERKRLSGAFSHDLRTPLTVLKGQSELLMSQIPQGKIPEEKILMTLGTMQTHICRMEGYVETMNQLQRMEDMILCPKPVSGKKLLEDLEEIGTLLSKGKEFQMKIQGQIPKEMYLDRDAVLQVYENLLSNGFRHADKRVEVLVSMEQVLSLSVCDDGGGFSKETKKKALEPFFQGKGTNGQLGMGLYICRLLCEKHDGSVQIEHVEKGAKITAVFVEKK